MLLTSERCTGHCGRGGCNVSRHIPAVCATQNNTRAKAGSTNTTIMQQNFTNSLELSARDDRSISIWSERPQRQEKNQHKTHKKRNFHQNCGSTKRQSEHFATLHIPPTKRVIFVLPYDSYARTFPPCPQKKRHPLLLKTPRLDQETSYTKEGTEIIRA